MIDNIKSVDMYKAIDYALLAIFAIAFFSSVVLSLKSASAFCVSPTSCDLVQGSEYSSTFGVKNSHYGVVIFAFLFAVMAWHLFEPHHRKHMIAKIGVGIGSLVSIYFIFLQVFVIKAFCTYCMIVDISLLLALALVLLHVKGKGWKGS